MMESGRRSIPVTQKSPETESHTSQVSSRISPTPFQNTYRKLLILLRSTNCYSFPFPTDVETKTGKKGFLGLSSTGKYQHYTKFLYKTKNMSIFKGTNANVYIQIIDRDENKSEPIQLKRSTEHRNKFERGQIDEFDIGK